MKHHKQIYCIVQTGFLGDCALALFTARTIKQLYPDSTVIIVTTPAAASMIAAFPDICQHVIVYDKRNKHKGIKGLQLMAKQIDSYSPDAVIAIHRSFRTTLLCYLTKARIRIGFHESAFSFLYTHTIPYIKGVHEVERNTMLLAPLGNQGRAITDPFMPLVKKKNQIVIAPGTVWAAKQWPEHYFIDLINLISKQYPDYHIYLMGGNADQALCQRIAEAAQSKSYTIWNNSLSESIKLLQESKVLIANDSAPVHLASLAGCATLAIFGPTIPEFGFAPLAQNSVIAQNPDLSCRPCSIHGGANCPLGTHQCMLSISPETIAVKLRHMLQSTGNP
jgi:heptosyltransferase-2